MRNLFDFITKYFHLLLFMLLETVSFTLLFQFNNYQGSVWFTSANAVTGKVYSWKSQVSSYFGLISQNEALTQRNVRLEQQVEALSQQLYDFTKDTTAAERKQLEFLRQFGTIPAKVVDHNYTKPNNLITIDKGSADGVTADMGVACGNGVVGIIYLVSDHYSVVIPLLNVHSNLSCAIAGRGYFGYLQWTGGDTRVAYLNDIPRHAHFRRGDKVVTSGYSSVFPSGVLVGKVQTIYNSPDGLSFRVKVRLSTDFSRLRDVCVISDKEAIERKHLMEAAVDSLAKP